MMSLAAIADLSAEQAKEASKAKKLPYIVELSDLANYKLALANGGRGLSFPFPNIGDYRPKGYKLIEYWTVALLGINGDGGPAISIRSLIEKHLKVGKAYAIIEEGQFQLVVGEFERVYPTVKEHWDKRKTKK